MTEIGTENEHFHQSCRSRAEVLTKEIDRTFAYTFIAVPAQSQKILMGVKREYDYDADIDKGDVTERQVYFKIEKKS